MNCWLNADAFEQPSACACVRAAGAAVGVAVVGFDQSLAGTEAALGAGAATTTGLRWTADAGGAGFGAATTEFVQTVGSGLGLGLAAVWAVVVGLARTLVVGLALGLALGAGFTKTVAAGLGLGFAVDGVLGAGAVATRGAGGAAGFATAAGFAVGLAVALGAGPAVIITGAVADFGAGAVTLAVSVGLYPQTCLRPRLTLGIQVTLPSIPARI